MEIEQVTMQRFDQFWECLRLFLYIASIILTNLGYGTDKSMDVKSKKNPALEALEKAYWYIKEGNEKDLEENARLLERWKHRLEMAKEQETDPRKRENYITMYTRLIEFYTELIQCNRVILGMFDGTSRRLEVEQAMEKIPILEKEIENLTKREVKRSWLTFSEVQDRLRNGWIPKVNDPDVLPYHVEMWDPPEKGRKR